MVQEKHVKQLKLASTGTVLLGSLWLSMFIQSQQLQRAKSSAEFYACEANWGLQGDRWFVSAAISDAEDAIVRFAKEMGEDDEKRDLSNTVGRPTILYRPDEGVVLRGMVAVTTRLLHLGSNTYSATLSFRPMTGALPDVYSATSDEPFVRTVLAEALVVPPRKELRKQIQDAITRESQSARGNLVQIAHEWGLPPPPVNDVTSVPATLRARLVRGSVTVPALGISVQTNIANRVMLVLCWLEVLLMYAACVRIAQGDSSEGTEAFLLHERPDSNIAPFDKRSLWFLRVGYAAFLMVCFCIPLLMVSKSAWLIATDKPLPFLPVDGGWIISAVRVALAAVVLVPFIVPAIWGCIKVAKILKTVPTGIDATTQK